MKSNYSLKDYKQSIEPDNNLSELFKDIFLFHWKEETSHAMIDELEWEQRIIKFRLKNETRQSMNSSLLLQMWMVFSRAKAPHVDYFLKVADHSCSEAEIRQLRAGFLKAYRLQYIFSGVEHLTYQSMLMKVTSAAQRQLLGEG